MIGRIAVAAEQGEILHVGVLAELLAEDQVLEGDAAVVLARGPEADDEGLAGGGPAVALFAGEFAHAGLNSQAPRFCLGLVFGELRGGREIAVGGAFLEQRVGGGHVAVERLDW